VLLRLPIDRFIFVIIIIIIIIIIICGLVKEMDYNKTIK
jgi:hypothetical protein